jgi:sn-glycerol 3-phosphate transport system substrate-binding protein
MNDTSLVDIRERQIMVRRTFLAALAIGLATSTTALAQTEIQWWHAMTGANNDVVNKLAADFNASQTDYKVVVAY